jgi:hypothetical protein
MSMSDPTKWKVPKWPFFLADALLLGFAYYFILHAPQAMRNWEIAAACVAFGAVLGIIPFWLDYRAMGKALEVNALGAVADKIRDLEKFTTKICAVTDQWTVIQESVGKNAETTALTAKQIADKMGEEVHEFSQFMLKMNDSEKAGLRLEVEKLRRGEAEWVQTLVRILDHTFAMHAAATRSNQPNVAAQIAQFQNACRDAVRRIGLTTFVGEANEAFDPERHQLLDTKQKPTDGSVIAETLASGYAFQGKLLRPALVRLREANAPAPAAPVPAIPAPIAPAPAASAPKPKAKMVPAEQDNLALEAD